MAKKIEQKGRLIRMDDFPSGDKEAVLAVMSLKNGKGIRMETGATPMT